MSIFRSLFGRKPAAAPEVWTPPTPRAQLGLPPIEMPGRMEPGQATPGVARRRFDEVEIHEAPAGERWAPDWSDEPEYDEPLPHDEPPAPSAEPAPVMFTEMDIVEIPHDADPVVPTVEPEPREPVPQPAPVQRRFAGSPSVEGPELSDPPAPASVVTPEFPPVSASPPKPDIRTVLAEIAFTKTDTAEIPHDPEPVAPTVEPEPSAHVPQAAPAERRFAASTGIAGPEFRDPLAPRPVVAPEFHPVTAPPPPKPAIRTVLAESAFTKTDTAKIPHDADPVAPAVKPEPSAPVPEAAPAKLRFAGSPGVAGLEFLDPPAPPPVVAPEFRPVTAPPPPKPDIRAVLAEIETLGDTPEIGLLRQALGAEPDGLFGFSTMYPGALIELLENRFAGTGSPENLTTKPAWGYHYVNDRRYGFSWKTAIEVRQMDERAALARESAR